MPGVPLRADGVRRHEGRHGTQLREQVRRCAVRQAVAAAGVERTALSARMAAVAPRAVVHPPAPPAITPPQSLEESALRVQNEANRELERLVPLLNLSDAQQDRVFSRLAENSVFWTPGLTAVGATETSQPSGTGTAIAAVPISDQTKSLTDLLTQPTSDGETPVLTPEQENAVVQDDLDRREWWTEMLGVIQGDMQSGTTTSAASTVTPVDPETITKEAEGADTVVD